MLKIAQLQRYKNSNLFKDRTDVRYLAAVFVGKKTYYITEVKKNYGDRIKWFYEQIRVIWRA